MDDRVAVTDRTERLAFRIDDDRGLKELVCLAAGVAALHRFDPRSDRHPLSTDDGPPRALHALPAVVPVHREETALDGRDADGSRGSGPQRCLLELLHQRKGGLGRNIAPVEMDTGHVNG